MATEYSDSRRLNTRTNRYQYAKDRLLTPNYFEELGHLGTGGYELKYEVLKYYQRSSDVDYAHLRMVGELKKKKKKHVIVPTSNTYNIKFR